MRVVKLGIAHRIWQVEAEVSSFSTGVSLGISQGNEIYGIYVETCPWTGNAEAHALRL